MTASTTWFQKICTWLDNNLMLLLAGFLVAFIPLYPKLPLFEAIPGYIVRVRVEDMLVLGTAVVWLIQAIRGKINWKAPGLWFLVAYVVFGALSLVSALFLIKTIPLEPLHIGKSVLHYFRYLEYFALLLFVFSAIKTKSDAFKLLCVSFLTVLGISVYGFGQKYYYWPVYSTMNREFSKGVRLYLTDHARVQSTFGGHYDLAAYLVIFLPILLATAFTTTNKPLKIILHALHALGVWLMVVAASRTSFGGYVLAVGVVVLLMAAQQITLKAKLWFAVSRGTFLGLVLGFMTLFFGQDIYERFLQTLESYPTAHYYYHHYNDQRKKITREALIAIGLVEADKPAPPPNAVGVTDQDQMKGVIVASDQRPEPAKPSDVYVEVPDKVEVSTTSATGVTTTTIVEVPRTYSANALKYGLSVAIRLDTLWPRAIAGFWRNPLLGSGYATLTKESLTQFTEAESTDNNFLRTLGETGLLGFLAFYGLTGFVALTAWRLSQKSTGWILAVGIGFIAATLGLLLNATYIDVFASSKVAFAYWGCAGLILALSQITSKKPHVS